MAEMANSTTLASINSKLESGEELTATEAKQWNWILWRWIAAWEMAFNRHEDGLMADDRWVAWDISFKFIILDPKTGTSHGTLFHSNGPHSTVERQFKPA